MSKNQLEVIDWKSVPNDIPDIIDIIDSPFDVDHWAEHIKPLLEQDGKVYFCESNCDHFSQSYIWKAKIKEEIKDLIEIGSFWSLHHFAYYGFFKPTVAEVIRQIPFNMLSQVDYFLVRGPERVEDLNDTIQYIHKGFHVARTILYSKPETIQEN